MPENNGRGTPVVSVTAMAACAILAAAATAQAREPAAQEHLDNARRLAGTTAEGIVLATADTPARLAALAARGPGDPHPFVIGTDGFQRFWGIVSECMQADLISKSGG